MAEKRDLFAKYYCILCLSLFLHSFIMYIGSIGIVVILKFIVQLATISPVLMLLIITFYISHVQMVSCLIGRK